MIRKKNVLSLNQKSIEDVKQTLAHQQELEREGKKITLASERTDNILVEERPVVAR